MAVEEAELIEDVQVIEDDDEEDIMDGEEVEGRQNEEEVETIDDDDEDQFEVIH